MSGPRITKISAGDEAEVGLGDILQVKAASMSACNNDPLSALYVLFLVAATSVDASDDAKEELRLMLDAAIEQAPQIRADLGIDIVPDEATKH